MVFETLEQARDLYRDQWAEVERNDYDLRTALCVQHGIVERLQDDNWNSKVADYLYKSLESLKNKPVSNPKTVIEIVRPALEMALVLHTPRDIDSISNVQSQSGVISEIDENGARIDLYVGEKNSNPLVPLIETIRDIPILKLPPLYQTPGAWVCWAEYRFKDFRESVGNFEPMGPLVLSEII
jgi:hypothetical protein